MPSLAFRKASICSRFSFSASCTLVVNPQHAICSRLILYWKLPPPSGSSCIGQDSLFHADGFCDTLKRLPAKFQFLPHGVQEIPKLDACARRKMPQVVKVARFVARPIGKGNRFLGRDFCKRIHLNQPVFGKVREFLVAAKNGALLERMNQMLAKRNVDLDIVPTDRTYS